MAHDGTVGARRLPSLPDVPPPVDGLACSVFEPAGPPRGLLLVLHGAGSRRDGHFAFARAGQAGGLRAVVPDLRGHGDSTGALGRGALEDVATLAGHFGGEELPVVLRGSSLGGWLALASAARVGAAAVIAICPASGEGLRRGLARGGWDGMRADVEGLDGLLAVVDLERAASGLGERLLLVHAQGDDVVPIAVTRTLHAAAPGSKLIEVPGGDHRSAQHDAELQGVSLRWARRLLDRQP